MSITNEPAASGPNAWLIEEMQQQYLSNPKSVPPSWQKAFANGSAPNGVESPAATTAPTPPPADLAPAAEVPAVAAIAAAPPTPAPAPAAPEVIPSAPTPAAEPKPIEEPGDVLRGVSARIVTNMESSLTVPTATSFREVPAKLLEVNRTVLNNHLRRVRGGKVSFTHVIGFAIVRAIADAVPAMNNTYLEGKDGKPRIVRNESINVGIAVDQQKADGSRSLMVPVIKNAGSMNFSEWVDAYEGLIKKVRDNKIGIDDLMGATVSITNPGTIGTVQSVPRLMPGQGTIIGLGRIGYPTEYQAADPRIIAQLGIS